MYNHFTHETNDVLSHQLIFFFEGAKKEYITNGNQSTQQKE